MQNEKMAYKFTNRFQTQKTLRFELRPIGRTLEYIERDGVIDKDTDRAEKYKKAKKLIDEYHKDFINDALCDLCLTGLGEYEKLYLISKRNEKEEKAFHDIQADLRRQIKNCFSQNPRFDNLWKDELIKKHLVKFLESQQEDRTEDVKVIQGFSNFTTYFEGFKKNRKNMYSDEEKSTAIAYRIIHENLPRFIDNIRACKILKDNKIDGGLEDLKQTLSEKYEVDSIEKYFDIDGFPLVVTQSGIDIYNTIIGGISLENDVKIKGINECINQHNLKYKTKLPKMKMLYKQILSDRQSTSFVLEQFESEDDVTAAINLFYESFEHKVIACEEDISLGCLIENINSYDLDAIYISNDDAITAISKYLFDDWSVMKNAISEAYDRQYKKPADDKKPEKYYEKKKKNLDKQGMYSIGYLNQVTREYYGKDVFLQNYFSEQIGEKIIAVENAYIDYKNIKLQADLSMLHKNQQLVDKIKCLLDAIKGLQGLIKPLMKGMEAAQKDEMFYVELGRMDDEIKKINPLYNKVRNFVTKKPYSTEKVKINFDKPTLLGGWDRNKERDNLGIILMKDNLYYLGIMHPQSNKIMKDAPEAVTQNVYRKMEYKYTKDITTTVPKCSTQTKAVKGHFANNESDFVLDGVEFLKPLTITRKIFDLNNVEYNGKKKFQKDYLRNTEDKEGYRDALNTWINFCKEFLMSYKSTSIYDYSDLKSAEKYSGLDEFYADVNQKLYQLSFIDVDASYIAQMVDEGKLYLFQIYNKDFSPFSKGTPNLHTLYWKMVFASENLKNVVYKLNGNAEIFYRKRSIREEDVIKHEAHQILKNKYKETEKKTSVFEYELIKDRRFTVDKFQFHVPITMNFQADGGKYISRDVRRVIHDCENLHIIGLDRGERNLLYLSVIDLDGHIKEQMSLNKIISNGSNAKFDKDYHLLLDQREKDNKNSRQNWKTVDSIKELKEGYLSQVIHLICQMMIKYNAIVVLEDLNQGFMRSRQKFEKQIYQKFEKMLIDKLNYFADKSLAPAEMGGLLHAYQLTEEFESFQKLGKQSGFLFYVPAWHTSKIDPMTGFVNLFYTKYENKAKSRAFISKFKRISYSNAENHFEFLFDYNDFTYKAEGTRTEWCLCTHGERIENFKNKDKNYVWDTRTVNLTEKFIQLFEKNNILWQEGNLVDALTDIENVDFYQQFMHLLTLVLQLRNTDSKKDEDWMVSPVKNSEGEFFDTRKVSDSDNLPLDADANGAYNIAKKGLWIVEQIKHADASQLDKLKIELKNKDWLSFAQEHTL